MRTSALSVVVMMWAAVAGCGESDGTGAPLAEEPLGGAGAEESNDARGTSTGNPNDGRPPLGSEPAPGGFCSGGEQISVEVDAQTDLGFSANDILAFAAGTHEATIRWNPHDDFTTVADLDVSTLSVTITHDSGEIGYRATRDIDLGGDGPTGHCPGSLRIGVDVALRSADGALDEERSGTLIAYSARNAVLWLPVATGELGGSLSIEAKGEFEDFGFTGIFVNLVLSEFGLSGDVSAQFDLDTPDSSARAVLEGVAELGLDACTRGGFPIGPGDEVDGVSSDDILGFVANNAELDVQWSDSTTSPAIVGFAAEREAACLILDDPWAEESALIARGSLSIRSDDGRIDGSWPGILHGTLDAELELAKVEFEFDPDSELPPVTADNLASVYGLQVADASGYDSLWFSLSLSIYADGGPTMGELRLQGLTDKECAAPTGEPEPLPVSDLATGCADAVDLLAASFHAQ